MTQDATLKGGDWTVTTRADGCDHGLGTVIPVSELLIRGVAGRQIGGLFFPHVLAALAPIQAQRLATSRIEHALN